MNNSVRPHILRTASEIAMGRYMRAPDHPTAEQATSEFEQAFANLAAEDIKAAAPPPPADDKGGADAGATGAADDNAGGAGAADAGDGGTGAAADAGAGSAAPAADDKSGEPPAADDKSGAPPADGKGQSAPADAGDPAKSAAGKAGSAAAAPGDGGGDADADAILKRLAKVVKDTPVEEAPPAPKAEEPKPLLTEDDEKFLETYDKEWGDVARGESLKRKVEYNALLKHVFGEIESVFGPVREMVQEMATRTHYADITSKVGEITDDEMQNVTAWVQEQPTYLQKAMLGVINEGTAEEVSDLVGRYREAKGIKPAPKPAAATEPPGGDTELSKEAKQAAASLAPVGSKRSVVQQPDDQSDFDGAFAKWADTI